MTHAPSGNPPNPADGIVHVRLIGPPDAVDRVAGRIAEAVDASAPSRHHASRKNSHHVLVRFEVTA